MSVILQILLNTNRISSIRNSFKYSSSYSNCRFVRPYSDTSKFITFDKIVAQRRDEARRSLVIQVNSKASFSELYSYCSKYAQVKGVHHYKNFSGENFMIVEFVSEENVTRLLKDGAAHQKQGDLTEVPSPFLWFRAAPDKIQKHKTRHNASLTTEDGILQINHDELIKEMSQCANVSEQIQLLYDKSKLNDICIRLKYLVARQLETILGSLNSNIEVRPFGSSVNGFGEIGCDLDLVLTNNITEEMMSPERRLVFHRRDEPSRALPAAAEALEARAAGVARVTRILHARVPILKFRHELAALHCDMACGNMSGVHMSELLSVAGAWDARVAALTRAVRRWARAWAAGPPRALTGFPLTLLALFALQQPRGARPPVLPPLALLFRSARKQDVRFAEDNLNCTFLRDLNVVPPNAFPKNEDNLETLLRHFFEFYSQFDFHNNAISIIDGVSLKKPNYQPLYIINPLDTSLNVGKNVSFEECERLKVEMRNAAWHLDDINEKSKSDVWGLLNLLEKPSVLNIKSLVNTGNKHRMIEMKMLFKEEVENQPSELRSKLKNIAAKISLKSETVHRKNEDKNVNNKMDREIKFKNNQVRNEVYQIRRKKMS